MHCVEAVIDLSYVRGKSVGTSKMTLILSFTHDFRMLDGRARALVSGTLSRAKTSAAALVVAQKGSTLPHLDQIGT